MLLRGRRSSPRWKKPKNAVDAMVHITNFSGYMSNSNGESDPGCGPPQHSGAEGRLRPRDLAYFESQRGKTCKHLPGTTRTDKGAGL